MSHVSCLLSLSSFSIGLHPARFTYSLSLPPALSTSSLSLPPALSASASATTFRHQVHPAPEDSRFDLASATTELQVHPAPDLVVGSTSIIHTSTNAHR